MTSLLSIDQFSTLLKTASSKIQRAESAGAQCQRAYQEAADEVFRMKGDEQEEAAYVLGNLISKHSEELKTLYKKVNYILI